MVAMTLPSNPVNGTTTADGTRYFDSSVGSTGAWRSTPVPVGGLPAGSIMAWGTNTPPANWLIADGAAVSRSVYSSLFAVIGTTYGTGDGSTTFNLPNLSGRVPVGKNGGTFGTLAGTGGAETITLTEAQLPPHKHTVNIDYKDDTGAHNHGSRGGQLMQGSLNRSGASTDANTMSTVGSGAAVNNLQPYLVVNYIIKASAGWTAGDSELATRVGTLEQNPNISGTLTVAGKTTLNGVVSIPNVPAWTMYKSNGGGYSTTGVINFNNTQVTTPGLTATRFTAQTAGKYFVAIRAHEENASAGNYTGLALLKNGVTYGGISCYSNLNGANGRYTTLSATGVIYLAVNDYIEVNLNYGTIWAGGTEGVTFSGHLIG